MKKSGIICLAALALFFSVQTLCAQDINVVELTIQQASEDLKNKKYSAKELAEAFLARIAQYNPGYNAIVIMNPQALKDAEEIDRRLAADEEIGPLAGIPVVIKDSIDVAGLPTTGAWQPMCSNAGGKDIVPLRDAPVVARLRSAGAVILGKTNIPPMSYNVNADESCFGPTYNAVDPRFSPGGSSTGTATAVSGGFAVAGLAEETGGSIQIPAAAQALASIKPTFALVPNTGVLPIAGSTLDVVGPHAKTVYDAAVMLDVMAGFTADDFKTIAAFSRRPPQGGYAAGLDAKALKGKRIGLYGPGWKKIDLSPEVKALYQQAITQLKARGAVVVEDPFAGSGFAEVAVTGPESKFEISGLEYLPYDFQAYLGGLGGENPKTIAELTALVGKDPFGKDGVFALSKFPMPNFQPYLNDPSAVPDMSKFRERREAYLAIFDQVMDKHKLDALVFPQMLYETPLIDSKETIGSIDITTTNMQINIAGLPGVTVPAGYFASGSPFSLIFAGRLFDEANLLAMAYDYEQSTKLRKAPVLVENPAAK